MGKNHYPKPDGTTRVPTDEEWLYVDHHVHRILLRFCEDLLECASEEFAET